MVKAAPVIIVKRKKRHHHGHHGGAWKVAYADFVTAMMAFFLVMWIVGQSQAVRAGVAGYFRNPSAFDGEGTSGIMPGHVAGAQAQGPPLPAPASAEASTADVTSLKKSAERIRDALRRTPELEALAAQIEIKATSDGLRIELIDSSAATFFDSASARLKPVTEQILTVIAAEIGTLGKPLAVEGHTDSRPYASGDRYTNWELSADRANAARRQLERAGLPAGLVRAVRGYADKQLANAADPLDPRNRRVSILVVPSPGDATIR
jgi:chemotaxis protein MotB